mmetsp:Transcript_67537/g.128543  ORF Transcript_67537/g.128543 Transcript_67537/m.128543 type:complete len:204 (+) Transcript_67537:909-1520(+)
MSSLIIFFTLVNGLAWTCCAKSDSNRLPLLLARAARKAAILARSCGLCTSPRSCARAASLAVELRTRREGRWAEPASTASLETISMAFLIVSISSARSAERASKSDDLTLQSAVISSRYFWSASNSAVVVALSASVSALSFCVAPFSSDFFEISLLASSMLSASCCIMASYACEVFNSSFSSSIFLVLKSAFSFSSMSTTPPL